MFCTALTVVCLALIINQIYRWMFYRPDNFPPGPPRLPILGSYPFLLLLNYKHLHKAVDWLCKYYKTDVLGLYVGNIPTIVANTTETVRECLNNRDLDGKPQLLLGKMRDPDFEIRGIFFAEGPFWYEQRRYLVKNLREFGFGRRNDELELEKNEEIMDFINLLKDGPKYEHEKKYMKDGKVYCPDIFAGIFGNIFMKVFLNERLPREKQKLLFDTATEGFIFLRKADDWMRMFSYVEWLADLFPNWCDYDVLLRSFERYNVLIEAIVEEQYKTYDPSHVRHFLDLYFQKIEETKHDMNQHFTLVLICADIFVPALTGNPTALLFLIQRFQLQPEILKKCQNEIDQIVGQGRLPTLDDRVNLPYVEATIRESLRLETLLPSGLPHTATVDTKFMGYNIPKGALIFSSLNGCNNDTNAWNKPEIFMPERFLDENGRFSVKLDKSLPFGAGGRKCAGETFARNTLFLVTTALIQNFNICVPSDERMPDRSETHTGLLQTTPEFWIKFQPR